MGDAMTLAPWYARVRTALPPRALIGLALIAVAAALLLTLIEDERLAVRALEREASALQARTAAAKTRSGANGREWKAGFEKHFPAASSLQEWVERIHAAASAAGVDVERTDYQISGEPTVGLTRYRITLPVKGAYRQVRAYVDGLLQAVPALALIDVELKRDAIGAATVDATLHLALYLREESQ
jgi:hypothetical protein